MKYLTAAAISLAGVRQLNHQHHLGTTFSLHHPSDVLSQPAQMLAARPQPLPDQALVDSLTSELSRTYLMELPWPSQPKAAVSQTLEEGQLLHRTR